MTEARSPDESAEIFLRMYGPALGVDYHQLALVRRNVVSFGKFVVFVYRQELSGIPVESSTIRVLTLEPAEAGGNWRVVYGIGASLVDPNTQDFPSPTVDAQDAVDFIRSQPDYSDWRRWKPPVQVIIDPAGAVPAARAWKFSGANEELASPAAATFFVDASTNELLQVNNEIHFEEVDGTVTGLGSPGLLPDTTSNSPEELNLPGILVEADSEADYADDTGEYLLEDLGTGSTTVEVKLDGEWVRVSAVQGTTMSLDESATPPETVDFQFNEDEDEFDTAQVNAFIHTQGTHDFFRDRAPDFTAIDNDISARVNIDDSCNAFFSGFSQTINFYNAAGSCPNTAFSTVVAHEYGHYIVNRLGLGQGAFGEGFADICGALQFDDAGVGRGFFGGTSPLRNLAPNIDYPCVGEIHYCGRVLGGVWWDIRQNFETTLDDTEESLDAVQQLFVDWALFTPAILSGSNSADEETAREVVIVDDDDGFTANGSPNFLDICDAFGDHEIDCPFVDPIQFIFPDGRPELLATDGSTIFEVETLDLDDLIEEGTETVHYSTDEGDTFESVVLTELSSGTFEVEIPVTTCGDRVVYYFSVENILGEEVVFPNGAPIVAYLAQVADDLVFATVDNFETDTGWQAGASSDDATAGAWERADPNGSFAAPYTDRTPGDLDLCYVTENGVEDADTDSADVDGGTTTLTSPTYDLSGADGEHVIRYYFWYSNDTGADPEGDEFVVEMSSNNGTTWTNVETIEGAHGRGWRLRRFRVDEYVSETSGVQIRFRVTDGGVNSTVEAAIDDFRIELLECEGLLADPGIQFQRGDVDGDGQLNFGDVFGFLNQVFFSDPEVFDCDEALDFDNDGSTGVADVVTMLEYQLVGGDPLPEPFLSCGQDEDSDSDECAEASPWCQ